MQRYGRKFKAARLHAKPAVTGRLQSAGILGTVRHKNT
jgi:hypothetical protein